MSRSGAEGSEADTHDGHYAAGLPRRRRIVLGIIGRFEIKGAKIDLEGVQRLALIGLGTLALYGSLRMYQELDRRQPFTPDRPPILHNIGDE
jgi:hypothetical protein